MRLNKSAILSLTVCAAAVCVSGYSPASAAADVPGLAIKQVGYNANGNDTFWNRNREYVDISALVDADVKGLTVSDSWAKSHANDNPKSCNTFTVTALPGVSEVGDKLTLPAGHTLRVYVGSGTPAVSGSYHLVYMNSKCGYHGHIFNNGGDTVWISKAATADSLSYNFDNGYYIKP